MDLYTNEDSQELLQSLDRALPYIEYALKNNKPMFEGERVPSKFTSLFFVQFNSTHLPKFSPLLSLTLFGVQSLSADC